MERRNRIALDTSVIISGAVGRLLEDGELKDVEIIIPVAALDELQAQASKGRNEGVAGLNEIKRLRDIGQERGASIRFVGERPSLEDIKLARGGRIDAIIRDVAKAEGATLYTSDYVQFLVAEAEGIPALYIPQASEARRLGFEQFFTDDTMSVHLKAGVAPLAKRGKPGSFSLVKIREEPLTVEELEAIIKDVMDAAHRSKDATIEIARGGAVVLQIGRFRVAVARPPFSDNYEVTIVRPIVKLRLEDYGLSDKLVERLKDGAEGILIAGPPGSGKSTFASSLAEFYVRLGKIVKTFESPKDLQVVPEVTQYGPLEGDFEKTAEVLLLVRPDYTIFDEMRKSRDFQVYVDMRLAGVGMVGVIHASNPVDAIQRFLGRTELGMLPHIIDTVIFIKDGEVKKVYELRLVVRVPTGMRDEDLARPIVEVRDFEGGVLEYEIYTFGEETTVVAVSGEADLTSRERERIKRVVREALRRLARDVDVLVESRSSVVIRADRRDVPKLLGRRGEVLKEVERMLGLTIRVEPRLASLGKEIGYETLESGNSLEFRFREAEQGQRVSIYADGKYVLSATVGKGRRIRVSKDSDIGREIIKHLIAGNDIRVILHED